MFPALDLPLNPSGTNGISFQVMNIHGEFAEDFFTRFEGFSDFRFKPLRRDGKSGVYICFCLIMISHRQTSENDPVFFGVEFGKQAQAGNIFTEGSQQTGVDAPDMVLVGSGITCGYGNGIVSDACDFYPVWGIERNDTK